MTAMNLIVQPHAAYLITDTAYYLADGTVVEFAPKVTELNFGPLVAGPPARAAFALTGIVSPDHVKAELATVAAADMRDVLDVLPDIMRRLSSALPSAQRAPGVGSECDVLLALAMWDEATGKPYGFLIGNEASNPVLKGQMPPFQLTRMKHYVIGRATHGFPDGHDFSDPSRFDPISEGGALLDDQRADPFGDDATQFTGVGGQGVLTQIGAAGIRYHLLRSWPDRVGERISP